MPTLLNLSHKHLCTELYQRIDAGVKFAIANAIERHRRLGESISILRDGKVVTLTANEIAPCDIENLKNSLS